MRYFIFLLFLLISVNESSSQTTLVLKPDAATGQDAKIWQLNGDCIPAGFTSTPADVNFGTDIETRYASWTWFAAGCDSGDARSLIRFSEISSVPSGAIIVSAHLNLFGLHESLDPIVNSIYPSSPFTLDNDGIVQRVISSWDESTVTWNTQPMVTSLGEKSIPVSTSKYEWDVSIDVTDFVSGFVDGSFDNYGFLIRLQTETHYRSTVFASSDHSDESLWPELVIVYKCLNAGENSFEEMCINHEPVDISDYPGPDAEVGGVWSGPGVTPEGIFTPTDAGIGIHELFYSLSEGCYSTLTMTVHNNIAINFDYSIAKGCTADTVNFINLSEPGVYRWNFGDGEFYTGTDLTPSHIYHTQGAYGVWLVVATDNGCYDSLQQLITTLHPLAALADTDADSICQGNAVHFYDHSIGTVVSWKWNFGDGSISSEQNPIHVYSNSGSYQAMFIVKDDISCSDTFYRSIYVDSIPFAGLVTDKSEVCLGERINFGLSYLYSATYFAWDFGDGTGLNDGSHITFHSYDDTGTYVIQVAIGAPVCPEATAYDTIRVKPYPIVNLGAEQRYVLMDHRFIYPRKI